MQVQGTDRLSSDAQSDDELAVGHNGQARVVLSDVTSHFPTEQLPQQVPDDVANKPEEAAGVFQLQRRSRQPRVCRSIQAEDSGSAASNVLTSLQGSSIPASSDTQAATAGRPAPRSSARLLQADALTAPTSEAAGVSAVNGGQAGICTRRQAKLNKQPSQHSSQHHLSQENVSSDDDFAVVSRSQRHGRVLNHAGASHSAATQLPGCSQVVNGDAQIDVAEKQFAMRRNRPRLQLNRKAKGMNDMSTASQAATGPNASTSSASQ